jgi:hypothetical protein
MKLDASKLCEAADAHMERLRGHCGNHRTETRKRAGRDALTKGSELDTEALLQRLRLHLGSGYTATWVEQNLSLTRLIASMVVHPNTEEKRRPPDDHGIVVTVADQLKRAAPAKEKRYVDGWLAVNSSEMGLVAYLLWQARQRSGCPSSRAASPASGVHSGSSSGLSQR